MEQKQLKTPPPKLRYSINAYLLALAPIVRSKVKVKIQKKCGNISKSTLSRWCNLTQADSADIPATALFKIADILNVQASQLLND